MAYNYKEIIEELIEKAGIPKNDVFIYDDAPLELVIEQYFQFCQQNLIEKCEEYNIQPARIYIRTSFSVNAKAGKLNDYYIIGINIGTFVTLYQFFTSKGDVFENQLSFLQHLDKGLDVTLDYLMFQLCCQFTYYHELAHLVQKSPELQNWIHEWYQNDENECTYSPERHASEFDADLNGATHIAFHILNYWKNLNEELRTPANLSLLISTGASAIFTYFLYLMEDYEEMYYADTCHPHPLVRILYIVDCFIQQTQGNLPEGIKIDETQVLQTAFRITDELFKLDGKNTIEQFRSIFEQEKQTIVEYVNNNLMATANQMNNLVINRINNRKLQ